MPTERNIQAVSEMQGWLQDCSIVISTNYLGLAVGQMTNLRRALRQKNVQYRVIKNTLALLAADAAGRPQIKEIIQGPTGIAFGYGDPTEPAKALADFIRESRAELVINGAVMGERAMTAADVQQLASLPSRDILISRLLGQMQAPISGLVNVLNGPIAGLARVLQAHIDNVGASANGNVEQAVEESPDQAPEDAAEQPAEDSVDQPVGDSGLAPEDSVEQPVDETVEQEPVENEEQPVQDQE